MTDQKKTTTTIDPEEVGQFNDLANQWWDLEGPFKPLHKMNPCRLGFLKRILCDFFKTDPKSAQPLEGLSILDIGCGGGLITEPLCRLGAQVTGIDAGEDNIRAAQAHAEAMGLDITYQCTTAEALAEQGLQFDAVISLEVVEHVANVGAFIGACSALTKPEGLLTLSTLNRTPKSFLGAIVAGEYILKWLPKGTHDWKRFIKPSELTRMVESQGLELHTLQGMSYNPLMKAWKETPDVDINYFLVATRG